MYYNALRSYKFTEAQADDVRGSAVYGVNDDKLGKIDDVLFDDTGNIRYVVIDTGGWLSSKKFIVPADKLFSSAAHTDDFEVNLTKVQVESFPPYDENAIDTLQVANVRSPLPVDLSDHNGGAHLRARRALVSVRDSAT